MARSLLFCSLLAWVLVLSGGLWSLAKYENTPGSMGKPLPAWPAASHISRTPHKATLVMLAHPRCPCARASLAELALLMAQCPGRVQAFVVFFAPEGASEEWTNTALWREAAAITGVTPLLDRGGREARYFQAQTSGETLVYDAEGRLAFQGGITGARGHVGDNAGRSAIVTLLTSGKTAISRTPVFGCSLHEPISPQPSGGVTCRR